MGSYIMGGDPAAGNRFLVGVQTPENQGVLGSGLTPEEAAAQRRVRMAKAFGLPTIPGLGYLSDETVAGLGVRQFQQGQERAFEDADRTRRMQEEAARNARELGEAQAAQTRQQQFIIQQERQRQAQLEARNNQEFQGNIGLAKSMGMTPVEAENFAHASPQIRAIVQQQMAERAKAASGEERARLIMEANRRQASAVLQQLEPEVAEALRGQAESGRFDQRAMEGLAREYLGTRKREAAEGDGKAAAQERKTAVELAKRGEIRAEKELRALEKAASEALKNAATDEREGTRSAWQPKIDKARQTLRKAEAQTDEAIRGPQKEPEARDDASAWFQSLPENARAEVIKRLQGVPAVQRRQALEAMMNAVRQPTFPPPGGYGEEGGNARYTVPGFGAWKGIR